MRAVITVAAAIAALALGCTPSFKGKPPLAFKDLSYTGPSGQAWPEKRAALPETTTTHHLPKPLEVGYVELNPQGKQALIFIHGLGSYLKFWRYQLDAFAARGYRVIAVDLPGYGKSDKPASFPYTTEAMADAVREVVKAAGVEKPILVGHSMGGQTALSYAIRFPDELRALVLTSPAGFEEFSRREKEWFRKVFTARLIKHADEDAIWGSVRRANFGKWRSELEWLIEERVRLAGSPEFDSYAYANVKTVAGLADNDFVRTSLDKVKAPTVIVYGDRDQLIPNPFLHGGFTSSIMRQGHERIAGSRLVALEGCGHTVQMDCPREYNEAVLAFLRGL
ncbi:Alpha/beta hydrolase fold protein [Minicystis rosea]|nr:Alpha/beta hydrolase fold protein [Minicystis rosea]